MNSHHLVPLGWSRVSLHKLARIQTGLAIGKKGLTDLIEVPYLRVANVQDGHLDLSEIKTVMVSRQDSARYALKENDVLMTEGGDFDKLGRGFVWDGVIDKCLHQNHVFAVRPDIKVLNPYFLSYQTGSLYGKRYFLSCAKQTTNLASINSSQLKEFPVLFPGIKEQDGIVAIIKKWDRAIDLTEKLLAEKRQLRGGLIQQLLTGKRRLPGFTKPWRTLHLGDAFRNRNESNRTDLPLLSIAADRGVIPRGEIDRKDSSSEDKSKYLRICPGDIGYNTMRMWQGVSGLSSFEGIVSPAYTIVTPKKGIDGEFMSLLFKSIPVVHLFCRHSQGLVSDTWNLKFRHFAEIKVTIPEETEQKAIAKTFRSVNRENELLQTKADALREQKKGLMQQLLTGRKRVATCAS